MIEKDIGKRIQEYRKKKDFTQEQLTEKIGISTHHLSAIILLCYFLSNNTIINTIATIKNM